VFVSPLAKKIADGSGLDLSGVAGSGPNGRILKSDVESALQAASQAPKKTTAGPQIILPSFEGLNFEDKQNSQIRKVIADRLSYSK
jgi:pyruvate dehydrogenase E2 component (dihydrolipoamide acetyltransferase)